MDFSQLMTLVNSVGFPITMALALLWISRENMRAQHSTIQGLKNSLDENTRVLNELSIRLTQGGR